MCDTHVDHMQADLNAKYCVQALTGPPSQDATEDNTGYSYEYLLSMPIHSLTTEKARSDWAKLSSMLTLLFKHLSTVAVYSLLSRYVIQLQS